MIKHLDEIQLEFDSAYESARRAAEDAIQRRRLQRGECVLSSLSLCLSFLAPFWSDRLGWQQRHGYR
jgi:hypothetical protein